VTATSPVARARLAGVFYLLTGGTAFAYSVRGKLRGGDIALNLAAHERLFRGAIIADLLGVAAYVVVVALLYDLLRPAGRTLSLAAALFGAAGCATQSFACAFDLGALAAQPDLRRCSSVCTALDLRSRFFCSACIACSSAS